MAKINKVTAKAAFGISILFGLSAGAAMADTLTSTSVSMPNGSVTVNINYSGHSIDGGGSAINTGTIGLQTTAQGTLSTYCVDLFDYIYTGNNSYTFNNNALAAGQSYSDGSSHSTWTTGQVSLITALLENGSLQTQSTLNTAALQIAIWDVEYDTAASNGTYNLTNHDGFYFTSTGSSSSSAITQAQAYLNDVTSGTWVADASHTVQYLTANPSGTQNLLYLATTPTTPVATPEPASVGIFGLGLIGLYAARRRKMI